MTESRLVTPADVAALAAAAPTGPHAQRRRAVSTSLLGIGPPVPLDEAVDLDDLLGAPAPAGHGERW